MYYYTKTTTSIPLKEKNKIPNDNYYIKGSAFNGATFISNYFPKKDLKTWTDKYEIIMGYLNGGIVEVFNWKDRLVKAFTIDSI